MFSFIKKALSNSYKGLKNFFGIKNLEHIKELKELEKVLLENNFGIEMTKKLLDNIEEDDKDKILKLKENLKNILNKAEKIKENNKEIVLVIGINGSGKTTSVIKLARDFKKNGDKALLVPADTFRAAAQEQLEFLAEKENIDFYKLEKKDSLTLVYKSITEESSNYEKIIIDTAGRIHQNESLLRELKKIYKIAKEKSEKNNFNLKTLIVLDSLQGQALEKQIKEFSEIVKIDGIILTKLDSGAKPGNIINIVDKYNIPIAYLTYGEYETEIVKFETDFFVDVLIGG